MNIADAAAIQRKIQKEMDDVSSMSGSLDFHGNVTRRDFLPHALKIRGDIRPIARLIKSVNPLDHSGELLAVGFAPAQPLNKTLRGADRQDPAGLAFAHQVRSRAIGGCQDRKSGSPN